MTAVDPELAAVLRNCQHRLSRTGAEPASLTALLVLPVGGGRRSGRGCEASTHKDTLLAGRARRVVRSVAVEEGEHGAYSAVVFGGFGDGELAQDATDVLLDRAFGHKDLVGDACVGTALGHEPEYLAFPRGEDLQRIVNPAGGE